MTRPWAIISLALAGVFAAIGALIFFSRLGGEAPHWKGVTIPPDATAASLLVHADPAAGAKLFRHCAACHSIRPGGPNLNGPNLHGVMGGEIGHVSPRFGYSAALRNFGGHWDVARMDAWLQSPRTLVPRTSMVFSGVGSVRDRADLIAYLLTQGAQEPAKGAEGK